VADPELRVGHELVESPIQDRSHLRRAAKAIPTLGQLVTLTILRFAFKTRIRRLLLTLN